MGKNASNGNKLPVRCAETIYLDYLGGKDKAKFTPFRTQTAKSSSDSCPSWDTMTQPFMGLPVKSNSRVWGNLSEPSYCSGPTRTIISSFSTPQAMFPLSK